MRMNPSTSDPEEKASRYWEEAKRARRLAPLFHREDDRRRLLQYAVELEEQASRLEADDQES